MTCSKVTKLLFTKFNAHIPETENKHCVMSLYSGSLESERSMRAAFERAHQRYRNPSSPRRQRTKSWVTRLIFVILLIVALSLLAYYIYTRYNSLPFHPLTALQEKWIQFRSSACPRNKTTTPNNTNITDTIVTETEREWKVGHEYLEQKRAHLPPSSHEELILPHKEQPDLPVPLPRSSSQTPSQPISTHSPPPLRTTTTTTTAAAMMEPKKSWTAWWRGTE